MTWRKSKSKDKKSESPATAKPSIGADKDALRPSRLADFQGQSGVTEELGIALLAARQRGEALDHILLYGPPGLGKTTIARLISNEMATPFIESNGAALRTKNDLSNLLMSLTPGAVLFIDEIHALPIALEELLYMAMEDFKLQFADGLSMDLPKFTLVGATTRQGLLSAPLKDRFGLQFRLEPYREDALSKIVERSARILGVGITSDATLDVVRRSRGTPRIANRLLKRCRDYAQVQAAPLGPMGVEVQARIDAAIAEKAMTKAGVNRQGLDAVDQKLMAALCAATNPMGIQQWAVAVDEEVNTVLETYEPYLVQIGLVERTQRGRVATALAKASYSYGVFGATPPQGLFGGQIR